MNAAPCLQTSMQSWAGQHQTGTSGAVLPLSSTLTAALSWTTHVAVLDEYLRSHSVSQVILKALGDIPLNDRISILRGTVSKQPANPDAWLNACLKRHHGKTYSGPQPVMHGSPIEDAAHRQQCPDRANECCEPCSAPTDLLRFFGNHSG